MHRTDNAGSKSYFVDSDKRGRKIRCENSAKFWLQLVIVYQHRVLTGEKKAGSYLRISGYTRLIKSLFLHHANLSTLLFRG